MLDAAFANSYRAAILKVLTPYSSEFNLWNRNATIREFQDHAINLPPMEIDAVFKYSIQAKRTNNQTHIVHDEKLSEIKVRRDLTLQESDV